MSKHSSALRGIIAPALFVALLGVSCNSAQCENLRDELTKQKQSWSRCAEHLDCIKIGGNPGDCTGVMTCNFAVNRNSRLEAERRVASLPEETVDCSECTPPNCVSGEITLCEPTSGQCIIVSEILDGGLPPAAGGSGGSGDSGDSGGSGGSGGTSN